MDKIGFVFYVYASVAKLVNAPVLLTGDSEFKSRRTQIFPVHMLRSG